MDLQCHSLQSVFRGDNSATFIFASLLNSNLLLNGKNNFAPSGRALTSKEANRK